MLGHVQVEFKDVSFCFPTRKEVLALDKVSLELTPGRLVALVGGSGSGKSTLVGLLQRLYDASEGQVCSFSRTLQMSFSHDAAFNFVLHCRRVLPNRLRKAWGGSGLSMSTLIGILQHFREPGFVLHTYVSPNLHFPLLHLTQFTG